MRRKDREITEFDEMTAIMKKCDVCRLALNDGDYPYILPLNFGMQTENGKVTLYFHGANEGRKYDLIRENPCASFEMDCGHQLVAELETGMCTMYFESVIGHGTVSILDEKEKRNALRVLLSQYHEDDFPVDEKVIPHTTVFKMEVQEMTAKRRKKEQ